MKISAPATEGQERASSRTFSARRVGYACLILIALVSRDVLAQPMTTINVTFAPGETTKTVQAPNVSPFMVHASMPESICYWPTTELIKSSLSSNATTLLQQLNAMENFGTATGQAILGALHSFIPPVDWGSLGATPKANDRGTLYTEYSSVFTAQQLAAGPATRSLYSRCLNVADARTAINEIRRVIRTRLGLPTGTLAPTSPGLSAPSIFAPQTPTK